MSSVMMDRRPHMKLPLEPPQEPLALKFTSLYVSNVHVRRDRDGEGVEWRGREKGKETGRERESERERETVAGY